MVSPKELKKTGFSKTIKGYSVNEVDEYVTYLLSRYNEAYNEHAELERKYSAALIQLNEVKSEEVVVTETILNAQKMAEAIIQDAKQKANEIKGSVSESCNKILDVYRTKVAAERDKLVECEKAVAEFKDSLYDAYRKHISFIDNIMPDEEPTPYFTDDELEDKAIELANKKINPETAEQVMSDVEQASDVQDGVDDTNV
ncbi:MAG: hypothetical protein E7600_02890 [Ruminococcaceae bacterium]|nr:hypothetical protein [Oscillospiraceae bacterium]